MAACVVSEERLFLHGVGDRLGHSQLLPEMTEHGDGTEHLVGSRRQFLRQVDDLLPFRKPHERVGHPVEFPGGSQFVDPAQGEQDPLLDLAAFPVRLDQLKVLSEGSVLFAREGEDLEKHTLIIQPIMLIAMIILTKCVTLHSTQGRSRLL